MGRSPSDHVYPSFSLALSKELNRQKPRKRRATTHRRTGSVPAAEWGRSHSITVTEKLQGYRWRAGRRRLSWLGWRVTSLLQMGQLNRNATCLRTPNSSFSETRKVGTSESKKACCAISGTR
ncbi:hypothetical protein BD410DRAFT_63281 [Rickenella mellea]|uniref:Uncharacterized protein n=1 Tax=Rickenella mellea TaxID=50990 RepID=A0A4Y7QBK1_9AGAM|nr:hypothetical protein BD410DRAFT_63281 [Rickenella mellea]